MKIHASVLRVFQTIDKLVKVLPNQVMAACHLKKKKSILAKVGERKAAFNQNASNLGQGVEVGGQWTQCSAMKVLKGRREVSPGNH